MIPVSSHVAEPLSQGLGSHFPHVRITEGSKYCFEDGKAFGLLAKIKGGIQPFLV